MLQHVVPPIHHDGPCWGGQPSAQLGWREQGAGGRVPKVAESSTAGPSGRPSPRGPSSEAETPSELAAGARESLSQLLARILEQLSVSAWLPAGALVFI